MSDKKEKGYLYQPYDRQKLFHSLPHKTRLFLAGNGAGKTLTNVIESYIQAKYVHPGKVGLVCAPTNNLLVNGWLDLWKEFIPKDEYKIREGMQDKSIRLTNGSLIRLRSSSVGEGAVAGINAAWVAFDEAGEEPNFKSYHALIKRARKPADGMVPKVIVTSIPPANTNHWMAQTFGVGIDNTDWFPVRDSEGNVIPDCWENKDKTVVTVRATTLDNPYLEPSAEEYVRDNIAVTGTVKEHYERFVLAKYVSFSGLIVPEFDPAKHVKPSSALPRSDELKRVIIGKDWGDSDKGAYIVIGIDSTGCVYVLDEEYHSGLAYNKDGWFKIFRNTFTQHRKAKVVFVDSAGASLKRICEQEFPGVNWWNCKKDFALSINTIRTLFQRDKLIISSNCKNLVRELQGYVWDTRSHRNVPKDGDDHLCDALRYSIIELVQKL